MGANTDGFTYIDYVDWCPTIESRLFWLFGTSQCIAVTVEGLDGGFAIGQALGFLATFVGWIALSQLRRERLEKVCVNDDTIKRRR